MIQSTTIAFLSSAFIYFSVCQGDICQINGLSPEHLKNLSYDPPRNELLSEAQDKKAWQTFVETYEIPVGKVQNWYNSIVDKNSAIQFQKHTVSKIISPDQNQTADAWKFGYRTVGIAECKDNKKAGIYVHTVKTAV